MRAFAAKLARQHRRRSAEEWLAGIARALERLARSRAAGPLRLDGLHVALVDGPSLWRCTACGAVHLHRSAGVCTTRGCQGVGLSGRHWTDEVEDYYAWLAGEPPRRLRVEELTGQTKPL